MKCVLPDALHARPANLVVRLVAQHAATIEIVHGERRADARKILDVLALGAHKGDEIEITATGEEADEVLEALAELIARNFDADLVPELGACAVEGIAIGHAWVHEETRVSGRALDKVLSPEEERARLHAAVARATRDVRALVRALPTEEAKLFEPEIAILRDVEAYVVGRIDAGESAEEATLGLVVAGIPDLVLDARTRILDALAREETVPDSDRSPAKDAAEKAAAREQVLITNNLTPSTVATLPPSVTGIVVAMDDDALPAGMASSRGPGSGYTSHAAILARSRGIPLLHVPSHIVAAVCHGDIVVLDTSITPARLWIDPSEALVESARGRRAERARSVEEDDARATAALAMGLAVRVNIGATSEAVPQGAEGVGLVRTELVFAGRRLPPSETEQLGALLSIARRARGGCVNVRLFDAGGDKPVPWLRAPDHAPDARGIALLMEHPEILASQLRAIARAKQHEHVRALLPLVRSASDVIRVRELLREADADGERVEVGAMIETDEAASAIDEIARVSDYVCIGTNDLAASVLGVDRASLAVSFDARVLKSIEAIVAGAHAHALQVTVCGEMAGDVLGARLLVGLGVDAISVAPGRVAPIKRSLAGDSVEACRAAASEALLGGAVAR